MIVNENSLWLIWKQFEFILYLIIEIIEIAYI